jgi:hypothetical protein
MNRRRVVQRKVDLHPERSVIPTVCPAAGSSQVKHAWQGHLCEATLAKSPEFEWD